VVRRHRQQQRATHQHAVELLERRPVAGRLGIPGRSKMTKDELVDAIKKANRKATAKAR
jgi:hypothetical protein